MQSRMVDRTTALGSPCERITLTNDDLGKSGTSSVEPYGFQRLIAKLGLARLTRC